MVTVFFTPMQLLVLNVLPYSQMFTHDYFITEMPPMFCEENVRFHRKHSGSNFSFTWTIRGVTIARRSPPKLSAEDLPELCTHSILQIIVIVISGSLV
jgi:hypothetical protein